MWVSANNISISSVILLVFPVFPENAFNHIPPTHFMSITRLLADQKLLIRCCIFTVIPPFFFGLGKWLCIWGRCGLRVLSNDSKIENISKGNVSRRFSACALPLHCSGILRYIHCLAFRSVAGLFGSLYCSCLFRSLVYSFQRHLLPRRAVLSVDSTYFLSRSPVCLVDLFNSFSRRLVYLVDLFYYYIYYYFISSFLSSVLTRSSSFSLVSKHNVYLAFSWMTQRSCSKRY